MSADGRFFAFESEANNLTLADDNSQFDIFVRDVILETTTRVVRPMTTVPPAEVYNPVLSADGLSLSYRMGSSLIIRSVRPTITSVSTGSAASAGGDVVTITGSRFTSSMRISIDQVIVPTTFVSETQSCPESPPFLQRPARRLVGRS
jgi:hypothetical protein